MAQVAEGLTQRGHEVLVVSAPPPAPTLREQARALVRQRAWPGRPRRGPSHFDGLRVPRRLLDRYRPVTDADVPDADVVIATWWETAEWVARLAPRKGAKVYFVQGHEVHDFLPIERVKATYRLPLRKIAISPWLAHVMRDQYGDTDVAYVPLGVDPAQFDVPPRRRQPLPTVGIVYATTSMKGGAVGLAALRLVADRVPDLRYVAFGSEQPSPRLPLPATTRFFYQPPQAALKDIYAQCDVFLGSSWNEGFYLPAVEAMACRCPVVATRVGITPVLITEGVNGYLAAPGDAEALAEGVARVLSLAEGDWRDMSEAAHQAAQPYTWTATVEQFEAALLDVVAREGRPR